MTGTGPTVEPRPPMAMPANSVPYKVATELAPFKASASLEGDDILLSRPFVGPSLVAGTVLAFAIGVSIVNLVVPECGALGELERQAVLLTFTAQCTSLLHDALSRQTVDNDPDPWTQRVILTVKMLAAVSNLTILLHGPQYAVDSFLGRPNAMYRWSEWAVLAFTMTFTVEAIDATSFSSPLRCAASQSLSTLCGSILPFIKNGYLWLATLGVSFSLYSYLFICFFRKRERLMHLQEVLPAHSMTLHRAKLGFKLMTQCVLTWTVLVLVWIVDAIVRYTAPRLFTVDYGFMADCVVDFIAKALYASVIRESSNYFPVRYDRERSRLNEERMRLLWDDARDVLMTSQAIGSSTAITFASPSIRTLVPRISSQPDLEPADQEARSWFDGREHELHAKLPEGLELALARGEPIRCHSVEELVAYAWHCPSFTCAFQRKGVWPRSPEPREETPPEGAPREETPRDVNDDEEEESTEHELQLEVSCSHCEQLQNGRVIIARDLTDRLRRLDAEKKLLSEAIEREKDEEASRFTRHEVKNSVLVALAQVEKLRATHDEAVSAAKVVTDPAYDAPVSSMLSSLRVGLYQTLETVLSQAMAREVVHGVYLLRTVPVRVDDVICKAHGYGARMDDSLFPVVTRPQTLPVVDVDPRLLLHIHRNAVSNAVKYGRKGGVVATEIEVADHMLTVKVINQPGDHYDKLRSTTMSNPSKIFEKGSRFHREHSSDGKQYKPRLGSKGDGAWIMRKCAECLQGACSYEFTPEQTIFKLVCPAMERLDESWIENARLAPDVYAIAIDDCDFQRLILEQVCDSLGLRPNRVQILGEEPADLEHLKDRIVDTLRTLPKTARVLAIVDENLDLPEPWSLTLSGSFAIQQARKQLTAEEEARLLCLIRSANDSPDDVKVYLERAHGFLPKCPSEPDRKAIMRYWIKRYGMAAFTECVPSSAENSFKTESFRSEHAPSAADSPGSFSTPAPEDNREVAFREITKVVTYMDGANMAWGERWRWLHRLKGIIATLRAANGITANRPLSADEQRAADTVLLIIESMRPLGTTPPDMSKTWGALKEKMGIVLGQELPLWSASTRMQPSNERRKKRFSRQRDSSESNDKPTKTVLY